VTRKGGTRIVVLAGGVSSEREVSLGSGRACAEALARSFPTRFIDVTSKSVPPGIDPQHDVVFSTLHGTFGEDGGMQTLLDRAGIEYAGCDAASSALTFDKEATKQRVREWGVAVPAGRMFDADAKPAASELVEALGEGIVIKPRRGGSSVGLAICAHQAAVEHALVNLAPGAWLAEQRILGREVTVGVLSDRPLPVVEIAPRDGVFDYAAKYTKGLTEYLAPAPLDPELARQLQVDALKVYRGCGCRDFARIDFMITAENARILLEINTLPGMKETSLLPMAANCEGMDFTGLVDAMVQPACKRLAARQTREVSA